MAVSSSSDSAIGLFRAVARSLKAKSKVTKDKVKAHAPSDTYKPGSGLSTRKDKEGDGSSSATGATMVSRDKGGSQELIDYDWFCCIGLSIHHCRDVA